MTMTAGASLSLRKIHALCWVAFMAAFIGAGAFVHISIGPVPITFQDFFVALSGLILGPRKGALAVLLYITAGSLGRPVFSGGRAGLGHLLGPTGGYLVGFVALAWCTGWGSILARRLYPVHREQAPVEPSAEGVPLRGTRSREPLSRSLKRVGTALGPSLCGLALLYLFGASWLAYKLDFTTGKALSVGVVPFLPFGTSKTLLAIILWNKLETRGMLPR